MNRGNTGWPVSYAFVLQFVYGLIGCDMLILIDSRFKRQVVQTTNRTMMWFLLIHSDQFQYFKCEHWWCYLDSFLIRLHIFDEIVIAKSVTEYW